MTVDINKHIKGKYLSKVIETRNFGAISKTSANERSEMLKGMNPEQIAEWRTEYNKTHRLQTGKYPVRDMKVLVGKGSNGEDVVKLCIVRPTQVDGQDVSPDPEGMAIDQEIMVVNTGYNHEGDNFVKMKYGALMGYVNYPDGKNLRPSGPASPCKGGGALGTTSNATARLSGLVKQSIGLNPDSDFIIQEIGAEHIMTPALGKSFEDGYEPKYEGYRMDESLKFPLSILDAARGGKIAGGQLESVLQGYCQNLADCNLPSEYDPAKLTLDLSDLSTIQRAMDETAIEQSTHVRSETFWDKAKAVVEKIKASFEGTTESSAIDDNLVRQ